VPPLGPLDRALTDHSITRHRIRPRFHRVGIRKQIGCCLFEIMLPCRHPKSQVGTLLFSTCAPRSNMNRLRISLFLVQPHSRFQYSLSQDIPTLVLYTLFLHDLDLATLFSLDLSTTHDSLTKLTTRPFINVSTQIRPQPTRKSQCSPNSSSLLSLPSPSRL
jgi:hypothetical protein